MRHAVSNFDTTKLQESNIPAYKKRLSILKRKSGFRNVDTIMTKAEFGYSRYCSKFAVFNT